MQAQVALARWPTLEPSPLLQSTRGLLQHLRSDPQSYQLLRRYSDT